MFVDAVFAMICLKNFNLLKTAFRLGNLLTRKEERKAILDRYKEKGLQHLYMNECIDSEGVLSYFLTNVKYRLLNPNSLALYDNPKGKTLNQIGGLTDAVCLMYTFDDTDISMASFAIYALNNRNNSGDASLF